MTEAEKAALKRFPRDKYQGEQGDTLRYAFIAGYLEGVNNSTENGKK